ATIAGVPVEHVWEFDAWARGAPLVAAEEGIGLPARYLLVSLGTGTSVLSVEEGRVERGGGTALGGGTRLGLGQLLLGGESFAELAALAEHGDRRSVDLLVGDIYRGTDAPLLRDLTAASFAKLASTRPEDLAHALMGLVGENVALLCGGFARGSSVEGVVYCGSTLSENPALRRIVAEITTLFGDRPGFLARGAVRGAVGAAGRRKRPRQEGAPGTRAGEVAAHRALAAHRGGGDGSGDLLVGRAGGAPAPERGDAGGGGCGAGRPRRPPPQSAVRPRPAPWPGARDSHGGRARRGRRLHHRTAPRGPGPGRGDRPQPLPVRAAPPRGAHLGLAPAGLRLLVLGGGRRWAAQATRGHLQQRRPRVSPAPARGRRRVDAGLRRLPLLRLQQQHGVQPDRHARAVPQDEAADDVAVVDLARRPGGGGG